jgi:hypothetical protein
MNPLEWSCIDADQSKIVDGQFFMGGRWLIVIEVHVASVAE